MKLADTAARPPRRWLALLGAMVLGGLACTGFVTPALAVGSLSDVTVIDRDTGRNLPVYQSGGRNYVAGRPGARYAIAVRNQTGQRVLTVISVDGVNVISGETAAWLQTGYVLAPRWRYQITGWRKSDQQVAAFEFTSLGDSYAARTGRPANVGVIGVAVFRERPQPMVAPPLNPGPGPNAQAADNPSPAPGSHADANTPTAPAESSARRGEVERQRDESALAAQPRAKLGTGHGSREWSAVSTTQFERQRDTPDEVITLYYDSRENLIAMGVIPAEPAWSGPVQPRPFPRQLPSPAYAPDPPA